MRCPLLIAPRRAAHGVVTAGDSSLRSCPSSSSAKKGFDGQFDGQNGGGGRNGEVNQNGDDGRHGEDDQNGDDDQNDDGNHPVHKPDQQLISPRFWEPRKWY